MLLGVSDLIQTAMVMVPRVLRVGPWRVSMYGVCAAVGLVAALGLSLKTPRLVGLEAERVWDAGLFAVMAAFVCSRLLLIAGDVHAFVRLPLVLLALPSFTYGGMVLTVVAVLAYLRWKRLPLLKVADAWAPCAAVLAAMLSVGRFFEGTELGMPTRLPWGMVTAESAGLRLHPVAVYAAIASVALVGLLMQLLKRKMRESPYPLAMKMLPSGAGTAAVRRHSLGDLKPASGGAVIFCTTVPSVFILTNSQLSFGVPFCTVV